jgi:hypothetical protein
MCVFAILVAVVSNYGMKMMAFSTFTYLVSLTYDDEVRPSGS